ncbi:MAG TPA: hypothetical protein VIV60_08810, partial [Polyangiaceae bacterium]
MTARNRIKSLRLPNRGAKLALTLAAAWGAEACLVITDQNKDQCAVTADCLGKGNSFTGTQCVDGVCVGASAVQQGCTSNAACFANPNTPNTYCSKDKTCLPILDSNCTAIVTRDGKPISPESIVLGVLAPLTGENAPDGEARVNATKLAHAEFSERAVGIPAGTGAAPRPIAMVICDQVADAEGAASHLATQVG